MATPSPELLALMIRVGNLTGTAAAPTTLSSELALAVASVRELLDAAACSVALVENDGAQLRFVAADGAGSAAITGTVLPVSRGIAGWVVASGQAIAIGDVSDDPRWARDVAEATDYLPQTVLAVPLLDSGEGVLGVMEVLDPASEVDTGRALDIVSSVALQVTSIVRLTAAFDHLGAALLRALTVSSDSDEFAAALRDLAQPEEDAGLTALASTFHDLASQGPEATALAQRILDAVASYLRVPR